MRMHRANAAIDPAQLSRYVEVPSGFSIFGGDIVRPPRARRLEDGAEQIAQPVEGHVVEHDRDDHRVGAGGRSRKPRDAGEEGAAEQGAGDRVDQMEAGRQRERVGEPAANAPPTRSWPRPPMLKMPARSHVAK
ncbi:hypothetical protein [Streptomyces werraensis]|uniref:hypothetical protein n=1 Tax=Streptomyces werraensis TaxID=68284 RepID=UPI001CE33A54